MPFSRVLPFLLLLSVSIQGFAQQAQRVLPTDPRQGIRDDQAVATVQRAIDALGGAAAISQTQTWVIQGHAQVKTPDGLSTTRSLIWEASGGEFRRASSGKGGNSYIVTGHGTPAAVAADGNARKIPPYAMRARFLPALVGSVLLKEFQNTNYNILAGGTKTAAGRQLVVVRMAVRSADINDYVTGQVWFFDQSSGLPTRVEYRLPSQASPRFYGIGAAELSDYRTVSGAIYPFQIVTYVRQQQTESITLDSINVNSVVALSDFDPPVNAK